MNTPDAFAPVSARVSILERLVPSLGLIVTAISGAVGAALIFRFFNELRTAETAGRAAFFQGTAGIEFIIGVVLVFAALLTGAAIIVSVARLFTTNTTSSPSGLFFLLLGLLSLVPPCLILYIMFFMKGVVLYPTPGSGGVSAVADKIEMVCYGAIGAALIVSLILLAFSFVPISSRTGRKPSTVICLILVEVMIVATAGIFFVQGRVSLVERGLDRVDHYSGQIESPATSPTPDDEDIDADFAEGNTTDVDPGIVGSNSSRKISGGVLNARAVKLQQPEYPPAARAVRAAGTVNVQVTVDEKGNVILANAVSGHPLLRPAAVQAARSSKFSPTMLSGQAVKVTGVIVYNFVP